MMYSPRAWSKPGRKSGRLAKIAAQFDHRHAAVNGRDFPQHGKSVIARAIVHKNDFERLAVSLHYRLQAVVEVSDVLLLVMQRDDDGVLGHSLLIINRKAVLGSRFSVLTWVPLELRTGPRNCGRLALFFEL